MRNYFLILFVSITSYSLTAQCSECPMGATQITGSSNINEQNNADDYCITGSWSGTIQNIANGSTITICPSATWTMPGNVTQSRDIIIDNYGAITDGGSGHKLFIQNQTTLNNFSSGTISVLDFENQEGTFSNLGALTAENIYLHGTSSNSGTMTSTADCGGTATTSCGFFIGNKSSPFNNQGTVNMIDGSIRDGVVGATGVINSTGTLELANNSQETDNIFIVNNLILGASSNVSQGDFTISGILDCNNANLTATACFDGGSLGSSCSGGSISVTSCIIVPVTIKTFDLTKVGNDVIAAWEVGAEINVSHYEILTSTDGQSFDLLAQHEASGDAFYQLLLSTNLATKTYYQLKSVDLDGTVALYQDIKVLKGQRAIDINVFPNPAGKSDILTVHHGYQDEADITLTLTDMSQKTLLIQHLNASETMTIDLSNLDVSSGVYLLQVKSGNEIHTEKVLVR